MRAHNPSESSKPRSGQAAVPVTESRDVRADERRRKISASNDNKMPITVSIVEDDVSLRSIYAKWLKHAEDFKLLNQYGDGALALAALPQEKPDVVLMDINLPGLNGVECVRQLKGRMPATQFVMITVYEDPDRVFNALAAGATGFLLKETQQEDLLTALRDVHRGGSPMSSGIARKVVQCFQKTAPQKNAAEAESQKLSAREQEVLELVSKGYLLKEVSESLRVSEHTIDTYMRRIYEKLHVHSRAQAVAKYAELQPQLSSAAW
jgi:DNA-binding NarL/FixJ family response regulator